MPAYYSHYKFGKLVLKKLTKEQREVVRNYPEPFIMGLQGPDFLFFYKCYSKNELTEYGRILHHSDTYSFFERALNVVKLTGMDSPQYSYLMGFICHFVLDNACHPFVNKFMKETGCGHCEIEGDLDSFLLTRDGHKPHLYKMDKIVPSTEFTAVSMVPFYEYLSEQQIRTSLKWMKTTKRFFMVKTKAGRKVYDMAFHIGGNYKKLYGHVLYPEANEKCRRKTEFLANLMYVSVDEALGLIKDFENSLNGAKLPDEFRRDFNGKMFF